jgi:hypothetical protein
MEGRRKSDCEWKSRLCSERLIATNSTGRGLRLRLVIVEIYMRMNMHLYRLFQFGFEHWDRRSVALNFPSVPAEWTTKLGAGRLWPGRCDLYLWLLLHRGRRDSRRSIINILLCYNVVAPRVLAARYAAPRTQGSWWPEGAVCGFGGGKDCNAAQSFSKIIVVKICFFCRVLSIAWRQYYTERRPVAKETCWPARANLRDGSEFRWASFFAVVLAQNARDNLAMFRLK